MDQSSATELVVDKNDNVTVRTSMMRENLLSIMEAASAITDSIKESSLDDVDEIAGPLPFAATTCETVLDSNPVEERDRNESSGSAAETVENTGESKVSNDDKTSLPVRYLPPTKKDDAALTFPEK
jgi:hypothetical protein